MDVKTLLREKRAEIFRIAASHGARNVRVFGSIARGEADEKSDIDLLVMPQEGFTLFSHAALIRELEKLLGRKVDVVSERGLRERVRQGVLRDAVPL